VERPIALQSTLPGQSQRWPAGPPRDNVTVNVYSESLMSSQLLSRTGDRWAPVPVWAEFFRSIGRRAVCEDLRDTTVALLVPTRSYVSAFLALGVVEASLGLTPAGFERLEGLAPETKLSISTVEQQLRRQFLRYEIVGGRRGMWVTDAGGGREFYPESEWNRISLGDFGLDKFSPGIRRHDEKVGHQWDEKFVKAVLGVDDLSPLLVGNQLDAAIVGTKTELSREFEDEPFAVELADGSYAEGHVEDVIRTMSFANRPEAESFRTDVLSHRRADLAPRVRALEPPVFICDAPEAFLKHGHEMSGACRIAVFDLAARGTTHAVDQFNREHAARATGSPEWPFDENPPPGVSVSIFYPGGDR